MGAARTKQLLIHRQRSGRLQRSPDDVVVEEPLEIRLDGHTVATTMRTPGDDVELAVGFLHAEGLLDGYRVGRVRHCTDGHREGEEFNVIVVETDRPEPPPSARLGLVTAACGVCGSATIDELTTRLRPLPAGPAPAAALVLDLAARVRTQQPLFERTGGVHAAAAIGPSGDVVELREDVGRHNAVDKVVGRLRLDGALPATGCGLFVSGRAGYELVQKAWAAGFSWMVAVGAPTSLAVTMARRAGLVLVGFAGPGGFNLYAPLEPDSTLP